MKQGEGLDVDSSDIFSTNTGELFVILKDGSIRKTIIHIVDISSWRENWGYPRFHIYECEKIKEMQNRGKKHRYKASGRKDSEFYLIKKDKKWNETLEICSYCLNEYNNQFNFNKIKQNFSLGEYIESHINHSKFSDVQLDICTVPNAYTKSWSSISKKRKEQENYICQTCGQGFSDKECKKFLHVHHIDANKRNNTPENLKVLCIECHCKEHNHGHIKQSPMYKEWLKSKYFKIQINK